MRAILWLVRQRWRPLLIWNKKGWRNGRLRLGPRSWTACAKQGLVIIGAGVFGNVVRMLMPLVITDEQLDQGLDILESALDKVEKTRGRQVAR